MEAFVVLMEGLNLTLNVVGSGLGLLMYVLQAWALYTIAERRGINKPWLAWIPVANMWILGSISDQYQYVVKGKVKNKRKIMLGIQIAMFAITTICITLFFALVLTGAVAMDLPSGEYVPSANDAEMAVSAILLIYVIVLACTVPLLVVGIIYSVFCYMAVYDLFCSCDPKNSTLYLVLSLVGAFTIGDVHAVCMFLCRDRDLGMPPRKTETVPVAEIPE